MKKIKALVAVFAVIFAAVNFTSCDTEPVDPVLLENIGQEPGTAGPAVFKVDFSGETFVATSSAATVNNANIAITGIKGTNGQAVSILIDGNTVGNYPSAKVLLDYTPSADSEYSYTNVDFTTGQESGTVSITSIDTVNKTISGTFSFVGWWGDADLNLPSIAFTNGSFQNVPYTGTTGGGPVTSDEYFKARVDGQDNTYEGADLLVALADAGSGETISINAFAPDHKLVLSASSDITPGTYQFSNGAGSVASARFISATDESFPVNGGSLTITSNTNGFLKGTFSFTVTNDAGESHVVTSGDFNVEYDF